MEMILEKDYNCITDETMRKVCDALQKYEMPFNADMLDEIGRAICEGTRDSLNAGFYKVFPHRLLQLKYTINMENEAGQDVTHFNWNAVAGFSCRSDADKYKERLQKENPNEQYEVWNMSLIANN